MWTYTPSDLTTTTTNGRLNSVRILIGDTDSEAAQLQDEEIYFALAQTANAIYGAASFACMMLAAKYARMVDTQLDGALEALYSDRLKHYTLLSQQITELGKRAGGRGMGVSGGGISLTKIALAHADTDRPQAAFKKDQFDYSKGDTAYIPEYS